MTKIFISYSHADEDLCDMLRKHLAALKHRGLIETWHDRRIKAGDEFENVIDQQMLEAQIILLLVSADFIASRYCYEIEMQRALKRHDDHKARVVPVILRPCDWQDTPFGKLMAVPKDGRPVKAWPDIDEAFLDVVRHIKAIIGDLAPGLSTEPSKVSAAQGPHRISNRPRSGNLSIKKEFTEEDKDNFLEDTFAYMLAYFENSLAELEQRHEQLSTRLRKVDENRFTATIYERGHAATRCKISLGGTFGRSIGFSYDDRADDNSYNESLSVDSDDHHLFLRAMGMALHTGARDRKLSQEGAAELYWSLLVERLQ